MSVPVVLVLAMSDNGVIGDRGGLPWRIPDDMKRFKRLTLGKPIIMGRKTWDSFPKKPLPGRTNIVVTHDTSWRAEGAVAVHSFDAALTPGGHQKTSHHARVCVGAVANTAGALL